MISVIIPVKNREKLIIDSMMSVLDQDYRDIELIVVEDGSTDNTYEAVLSVKDNRVRCLKLEESVGQCEARNRGAEIARGEYIAYNDSDDIWHPNKLSRQLAYLTENNADIVFCGINRNIDGKIEYYPPREIENPNDVSNYLDIGLASTQTIMLKKTVIETMGWDPGFKRLTDRDLILTAFESGFRMAYLNEALVDVNVLTDSVTNTENSAIALKMLVEKHSDIYTRYPDKIAKVYAEMACLVKDCDRKLAAEYLEKSLKEDFKLKTITKYLLNIFRIW